MFTLVSILEYKDAKPTTDSSYKGYSFLRVLLFAFCGIHFAITPSLLFQLNRYRNFIECVQQLNFIYMRII